MKIRVLETEIEGEQCLEFEYLTRWEHFDIIAKIFENDIKAETIQKVDGIIFRSDWYQIDDFLFELFYDKDIPGNFMRSLTREVFEELFIIHSEEDTRKRLQLLNEINFIHIEDVQKNLRNIAEKVVFHLDMRSPSEKILKINDYLTLELRNTNTFILVDGRIFNQCLSLYLIIPDNQHQRYIDSIDEANENFNIQQLGIKSEEIKLSPEDEFWGHCSNIQAWVENNYDTRLIHQNLAFPLLKRLAKAGDPLAKKVFKEEIAKRYKSGFPSVVKFLEKEGYLKYLSKEELKALK